MCTMTQTDNVRATNEMALFIFLVPQGTVGQELFISPVYQSLRKVIARRCNCEFAVFDGNTLTQRCMSNPHSVSLRPRFGYSNSNLIPLSYGDEENTNLLLAISNTYEQLLLARGNWLVQVHYQTEPSGHHFFMRLVAHYGTQLSDAGLKRAGLSKPINQGFKYTTLAAITHEKLRTLIQNKEYLQREQAAKPLKELVNYNRVTLKNNLMNKSSRNSTTQTKALLYQQSPLNRLNKRNSSVSQESNEEMLDLETPTTTSIEMYTKFPLRNNASSGVVYQNDYLDMLRSRMNNSGRRTSRIHMGSPPIRVCENSAERAHDMVADADAKVEENYPFSPHHCDTLDSESSIRLSNTLNTVTSVTFES